MADSVKIKITGDDSDFMGKLSGIGQKAGGIFKGMMASQIVTKGISMLTSGLKSAIDTGMRFEASMSQVVAISGATGAELELLTETAKHYGETTMFSASQASEALSYMALAGWDAQQSVAALPGVLDLAAASGMDLGRAADAVTDYLSAFGMEASQAGYMADLMAYAQSNANTSASQLSDAYGNCATSMHAAGQDIETTTAMLMALANQGIKGSEAGTQMAAVMRDLTQKMADGQIKIGDTAVQVTDAAGNFRDLNDIIAEVGRATEGMGTAEQSAAIMTTFTARSVKAIQTILNEGVDSVNAYEDALRGSSGTAAEQSKTMMDNLQGDVRTFQSAMEGVQITASESMNGTARSIVQEGTSILEEVNRAGKAGGIGGMADALIAQIPSLLPKVTKGVEGLLSGLGKRLPGLVKNLIATVPDLLGSMGELVPGLIDALTGAAAAAAEGLISRLPDILGRVLGAIPGTLASLLSGAGNIFFSSLDALYRMMTGQVGKAFNLDQAVEGLLAQGRQGEHILTLNADVDAEVHTDEAERKIVEAIESIRNAFSAEGLSIDTQGIVDLIGKSDAEIIAACKAMGMSDEGAGFVAEQVRALEKNINDAISDLNLGDDQLTKKVQQLVTSAGTSKAQLIDGLKALGLSPTEIAEVTAIYEKMNGDLTAGVPNVFENVAQALTDGQGDSSEVVGALHDQIQSWFDDAVADVDAWAELEISKLDPAEAGYEDAIADIKTKAGELKTELEGVKTSADEWVDANAGAATETVKDHIDGLNAVKEEAIALSQEIDAMTEYARGKVKSAGENAYRTLKIGGIADAGTIDLAFTWAYNGHKEADAAIEEAREAAIQALQAKNLDVETYNARVGEINLEFDTQALEEDTAYIGKLQDMFSGLFQSTVPREAQDEFSNALDQINLLMPIKKWADGYFEGEAPEMPQELLQRMFPYTSPENLNYAWQNVIDSGQYGFVADAINEWCRGLEREASETIQDIEWGDLATVLADAVDLGLFNGTELEGLRDENLLAALFGGINEDAQSTFHPELNVEPEIKADDGTGERVREAVEEVAEGGGTTANPTLTVEPEVQLAGDTPEKIAGAMEDSTAGAGEGEQISPEIAIAPEPEIDLSGLENARAALEAAIEGAVRGTSFEEVLERAGIGRPDFDALAREMGYDPSALENAIHQSLSMFNGADILSGEFEGIDLSDITVPIGEGIGDGLTVGIESSAGEAVSAGQMLGQDAADAVGDGAQVNSPSAITIPFGEGIAEGVQTGVEGASGAAIAAAMEFGRATAEAVGAGIDGGSGAVDAAARQLITSAISAAQGQTSGAPGIGRSFASGLASGIQAGRSAVIAAAISVANAAAQAARSALQINSPSKVTRALGEGFDEGFAVGIDREAGAVVRSAVKLVGSVAGAANLKPRMDLSGLYASVSGAGADAAAIDGGGDTVLYINGREMARTMKRDNSAALNGYTKRINLGYGRG